MCSMTMAGRPSTMPCTVNRTAATRPGGTVIIVQSDRLGGEPGVMTFAKLFQLHTQLVGQQPHRSTPDRGEDSGQEKHRRIVVRCGAKSEGGPGELGVVVGPVVDDLLHLHRLHALAQAQRREGEQVTGEAGIDAVHVHRGAAAGASGT